MLLQATGILNSGSIFLIVLSRICCSCSTFCSLNISLNPLFCIITQQHTAGNLTGIFPYWFAGTEDLDADLIRSLCLFSSCSLPVLLFTLQYPIEQFLYSEKQSRIFKAHFLAVSR